MADNGRWFKLWTSALDDPSLGNLDISDWGRWAKFGAYLKAHGTNGEIELSTPFRVLCSYMQCSPDDVISTLMKFPNCTVMPVTDSNVTFRVRWENWHKYQGDFSGDRVKRYRDKKVDAVTPKKRREEMRGDEKRIPPHPPPKGGSERAAYGESFLKFWAVYPKRIGKGAAWSSWARKVRSGDAERIMAALEWQTRSAKWVEDDGRFIPNPSTYLNQRRWEDEKPVDSFLDGEDKP